MSRDSSRKPSGSSSHSSAHSPTSPGNQSHSGRRITPTTTGNMLGVGVSGGSGLMGYNSGWQVWGSGSPSSQRNPSISSAASAGDIPSSQNDSGYRGTIREGWTSSRPASGTWEEDDIQSPLKEFSQSHEAQTPLSLHPSRQRQASVTPFSAPRGENRPAKLSPRASFEHNLNLESTSARYNTAPSSATFVSAPYSAPHPTTQSSTLTGASGYDALITSSSVSAADDLSLHFRGMAVEDDYSGPPKSIPPIPMPSNMMQRPQVPASLPRPPYNNYPGFSDYSYGFDAPRAPVDPSIYGSPALGNTPYPGMTPQGLLPTPTNDLRQPNVFYDFGSRHPASQFYYPLQQGIMFPPPTSSPMLPPALLDKKRELSYTLNLQQQLVAQALMYPRTTSSPHLPIYPANVDYPQLPLMMPGGALYGANLATQLFHQGIQQGSRSTLQSPLLHEFHANKTRNWELRDIMNHIVEFSGDQHGSRLIQHKLESASSEEKQKVFEEIVPHNVLQLVQDVFGNYVIQKLFEHGTQVQKGRLAAEMEGHMLALSKQMYGCRVVQKAIECILPEQQASFVRELEPHVMECIYDANGNHASGVIQKLIERVSPDRLGFVYAFRGNVQTLATHTYGCRVLQRALQYLPEVITIPLVEELRANTLLLMQNQFGNYVMQFVIEHGRPQDSIAIVARLRGQLLVMARHKFASNVCETALQFAVPEIRRQLVDEILSPRPEGAVVLSMIKDQYANYVLQRAVRVADLDQQESLINQIRPQLAILHRISNGYSKHLVSIEKLLQELSPPQSAATIA